MPRLITGIIVASFLAFAGSAAASERQREQFLQAESALKKGRTSEYRQLKPMLVDYPLYGYLDYWELRRRLSKAKADDVEQFLQQYPGQPISIRLRHSWLHKLGQRKDWDTYLQFYTPQSSVTLQCYDVRARLQKGDHQQALKDVLSLWLVGHSQPDACNSAFDQLYASGTLGSEHIWARIRLAFKKQKSSLAGFLAKRLSAEDRKWVKRWEYAHRRPTSAMSKDWAKKDTPLVREILVHAAKRLARHKPEQAWKHWQSLSKNHRFRTTQQGEVLGKIGLYGALENHPQAAVWLASVPNEQATADIRQWRVRTALADKDWDSALHWINELTENERNADNWRYWRAYALEAKGLKGDAFTAYARLSDERSYFGFLAADQLKRPYQMNDVRLNFSEEQLQSIKIIPAIERARELYLASKRTDARREWFHATRELPQDKLKIAASIAHSWGWYDRAIITASQARHWSDLALRFPLPHRESIFANAGRYDLDPALIYGVIRQESAFMEDARSAVGALGLMQLMPSTGKQTARAINLHYRGQAGLIRSDNNIRLGSAYLNKLLTRYNGSPVLAAAAYNAGPHRVSRWLPTTGDMNASLWMERIPFKETRTYVRRVLAYATIFEWRLEQPATRLSNRLPTVKQRY
ncbi:Soluble lytic murein transglycosylase precursor [hydrothermal vent metagenome]|uniref:Soluble lytic murein transglycosylase n=1 Tax=hydrothermal vent metagenome TaxID=652676 RepID=A0A3B0YP60_9ZZZZ